MKRLTARWRTVFPLFGALLFALCLMGSQAKGESTAEEAYPLGERTVLVELFTSEG